MSEELETFPFSVRRWTANHSQIQSAVRNPYTGVTRVADWGRQILVVAVELPPQSQENGRALLAWIAARGGMVGRFKVKPPYWLRQEKSPGVPRISGDGQSGHSITVAGLNPNSVQTLQGGMHVTIGGRLHMLTGDVVSDADGNGTMGISPGLVGGDAEDGDAVEWREPTGIFRLGAPTFEADWRPDRLLEAMNLTFVEAYRED